MSHVYRWTEHYGIITPKRSSLPPPFSSKTPNIPSTPPSDVLPSQHAIVMVLRQLEKEEDMRVERERKELEKR